MTRYHKMSQEVKATVVVKDLSVFGVELKCYKSVQDRLTLCSYSTT